MSAGHASAAKLVTVFYDNAVERLGRRTGDQFCSSRQQRSARSDLDRKVSYRSAGRRRVRVSAKTSAREDSHDSRHNGSRSPSAIVISKALGCVRAFQSVRVGAPERLRHSRRIMESAHRIRGSVPLAALMSWCWLLPHDTGLRCGVGANGAAGHLGRSRRAIKREMDTLLSRKRPFWSTSGRPR